MPAQVCQVVEQAGSVRALLACAQARLAVPVHEEGTGVRLLQLVRSPSTSHCIAARHHGAPSYVYQTSTTTAVKLQLVDPADRDTALRAAQAQVKVGGTGVPGTAGHMMRAIVCQTTGSLQRA